MSTSRKVTAEQCRDMHNRLLVTQKDTLSSVYPKFPTQNFVSHTVEDKNEKPTRSLTIDEPEELIFNKEFSHEEQYQAIKRAAESGNIRAHHYLGGTFLHGWWSVPKNETAGIYHLQYAADRGHGPSMFSIANFYENGMHGFIQNEEKAITWHHLAAEHGCKLAQAALAKRYEDGRGVPKDTTRAIQLYCQAAYGDFAHYILARHYIYGLGIFPKDIQEGVRWAAQGAKSNQKEYSSSANFLRDFYRDNRYLQPPYATKQPRFSDFITFKIGAVLATRDEEKQNQEPGLESISADFNELAREKSAVFDELLKVEPVEDILKIVGRLSCELEKAALFRLSDLLIIKDCVSEYLGSNLATLIMDFNEPAHRVVLVKNKDCFEALIDNLQNQLTAGATKCSPGEKPAFDAAHVEIKRLISLLSGVHSEEEYRIGIQSLLSFLEKQAETLSASLTEATSSSSSRTFFKKASRSAFVETCMQAIERLPPYIQKIINSISKTERGPITEIAQMRFGTSLI